MPENQEVEKRDIAELDFKNDLALQSLEEIEAKINKVNEISEKCFKEMSNNFNNAFSSSAVNKSFTNKELKIIGDKNVLQHQENNEKILKSSKSLYEKISKYAETYLLYQGFNELKQAAKEVIDEMVEVESSMTDISRVLNEDSLNIDNYRDKLIQLAYDYGNSFENVSDVTLRLAQAGFNSTESLKLTESTLLALNTAELNATEATSDMVAVMAQWNLMTGDATQKAEDYSSIIDKINKVADNFPTTSEDILNALKKTSSAFNLAGASIDETIAMITTAEVASQRGGKAIGTAMNNIILQLKDAKKLNIMENLGIDLYSDKTAGEFNSIVDIITQLSEKMQELQKAGKQNSQEMQDLLSVFTIFRRNIGAGLLSGVSGEDSTYAKVLETSMNSLGYSINENEKYMKTAKAAMEQFNAELLKLKTTVWDGGLEDVFRSMLLLGGDVVKILETLIDTFGEFPTIIGLVTLAFTTLNKNIKVENIKKYIDEINSLQTALKSKQSIEPLTWKDTISAIKNYKVELVKTTTKTALLKASTIALNATLSIGLSAAITAVISSLSYLINYQDKMIEKNEELIQSNEDKISKNKEEMDSIQELINKYEKYSSVEGSLDITSQTEFETVQKTITNYLIEQNKYTAEMKGNYDKQLAVIKQINKEKREERLAAAKESLEASKENAVGLDKGAIKNAFVDASGKQYKALEKAGLNMLDYKREIAGTGFFGDSLAGLGELDIDKQLEVLTKWKQQLEETGQVGSKAYEIIKEKLNIVQGDTKILTAAQEKYNNELATAKVGELSDSINTLSDYRDTLEKIQNIEPPSDWTGSIEDYRAVLEELISQEFPEFEKKLSDTSTGLEDVGTTFSELATSIENLSSQYDMVTKAADEFNQYGSISASTFKNIADNNLIDYLDVVNGKMVVNSQYFEQAAENARLDAIAKLQDQVATEILNIVTADLNGTLEETKQSGEDASHGVSVTTQTVLNSAKAFLQGKVAAQEFNNALKEFNGGEVGNVSAISENAKKQINAVFSNLDKQVSKINALSVGVTKASKVASSGSKSATKTFQEQSEERVKTFKEEIDNLESLEKSWVNKYKKLELFSTSDLKFITHQRINRYNEYLNQIRQLTGITEKDRTELLQEYSSKRQEAELEYFDLLSWSITTQHKTKNLILRQNSIREKNTLNKNLLKC